MANYSKLKNKKILVGITGGVAVYKVATLVNNLLKNNVEVKVIMTSAATQFVKPLTFESLLNDEVYVDMWDVKNKKDIEHIFLAKWADLMIIVPATANTISKVAVGVADNLLTTVAMALPEKKKIFFAPAMNTEMWNNKILQKNISSLKSLGNRYVFIEPESGLLACRVNGVGKLADVNTILDFLNKNV